jgi:hypothetical protein
MKPPTAFPGAEEDPRLAAHQETPEPWNPYGGPPGGSTPPPNESPEAGVRELRAFFWLALANTAIISVAGIVVWALIHGH